MFIIVFAKNYLTISIDVFLKYLILQVFPPNIQLCCILLIKNYNNYNNYLLLNMDLIYWLMLLKAPNLGLSTLYKALKYFETPQQVFSAAAKKRSQTGFFKKNTLKYLDKADKSLVDNDMEWQNNKNCNIITIIDKAYPPQLKNIANPPPIIYIRGDMSYLSKPQIAIIGSRNPTAGGRQNAHNFAKKLSKLGIIVTSGLASGIDASAHIGALESNMPTIAVCGTGIDRVYPAKHRSLAHQISTNGALISEFPIGTPPIASNFPRRNRIISGLSLGALIVEATIKSGSMVTAKLAANQGREVFAIPSAISNTAASGCHNLIKQGAKLVDSIEDIIQELAFEPQYSIKSNKKNKKNVDNNDNMLLKYLSYESITVDKIVEKSGISPQIVTRELLLLEISNIVTVAGAGYVLTK